LYTEERQTWFVEDKSDTNKLPSMAFGGKGSNPVVPEREQNALQRHNTKILNKYSQKRYCAASASVSTFMVL